MTEPGESRLMSVVKSIQDYASRLTRKKFIDTDVMETNLRRCLNTADITMLAIGHMVGSGVYVLSATMAKNVAGPAIVLSFLFSGFASFLAALCYAELGVRYPRSGSAYSYTYLALGEFWAFLVGWNVALEHVIGAAGTARACSAYINSLALDTIRNGTENLIGKMDVPYFAEYLDFLALGIIVLFTIFLSFGVRMTSHLNNVFSVANMIVIFTIIGVGAYFAKIENWTNPATGGFMPYGWSGVLGASASCFYAYVGFDSIASSGEEAKDPKKSIPRATMISMGIAVVLYVGVSTVLTLMVNYKDIVEDSGLPEAFAANGAHWAKTVVIVGAVSGMSTAIIGSLFALTRVIYVMSDDGLLFAFCASVNLKTKIPLGAMYIFASMSALMALVLDIRSLVEMMSIGTLFAYLIVSASVIILRYRPTNATVDSQELPSIGDRSPEKCVIDDTAGQLQERFRMFQVFINWCPGRVVHTCMLTFVIFVFILCTFVKLCFSSISDGAWWAVLLLIVIVLCAALPLLIVAMHQQSKSPLRYKVPLVPLIPALSIVVNAVLITNLEAVTWIRLLVWVAIGLSMYFTYGVGHSKLDVASSKSTLLQRGASPEQNWGSCDNGHTVENDKITEKKAPFPFSTSEQYLVDNENSSP